MIAPGGGIGVQDPLQRSAGVLPGPYPPATGRSGTLTSR
jgi:hypothetical protein